MKWLDHLFRHFPSNKPGASETSKAMASALAAAQAGDFQLALNLWEPLARAGNPRAQNNIGTCFAEGLGV
ncbi:MAG: sel1 repeat family protein, partial [Methylocella sp.]